MRRWLQCMGWFFAFVLLIFTTYCVFYLTVWQVEASQENEEIPYDESGEVLFSEAEIDPEAVLEFPFLESEITTESDSDSPVGSDAGGEIMLLDSSHAVLLEIRDTLNFMWTLFVLSFSAFCVYLVLYPFRYLWRY